MSSNKNTDVMCDLEKLISSDALKDDTIMTAQGSLMLASRLIEAAGYEVAQTVASEHTVELVKLAARIEDIAKQLSHP